MSEIIYKKDDFTTIDLQNSVLSIQLELNGLYFSLADKNNDLLCSAKLGSENLVGNLSALLEKISVKAEEIGSVLLVNVSDKVCLVPQYLVEESDKAVYFEANSISLSQTDVVKDVKCNGDILLLMAIDTDITQCFSQLFGYKVRYSHPLETILNMDNSKSSRVYVICYEKISFIAIYSLGELRHIETLPITDFASLFFIVNRLIVTNKLGKLKIVCNRESLKEHFSDYYPEVIIG